jgi:ATP-dependent DNA helicase RecQ
MAAALQILNNTFGYEQFRLNQAEIVDSLVNGRDVLALMPTGGGKSLCYQIPAMVRPGVGVIVSPLIALMQDQVDALNLVGVKAAFINSSLNISQVRQIERQLFSGELDLLYVAPERLLTTNFLEMLGQLTVSLFAIDEAHCVSQWGHDFRPEYQQLSILHQHFPNVPRIALTATADQRTRFEIVQQLELQNAAQFINSFDRPNIRYAISEGQNSRDQLWRFLESEHPNDAGIVYCLSRKKVEATAEWLQKKGRNALPYHAGLHQNTRQENQQAFLREEGLIIVATIAFGMGIDKPDVRFVAHLSLPKSIEAYYQETGRAGRDGEPSAAWMAYGLQDVITLRQMMQQSDALEAYKQISQQKLDAMLGLCESTTCRRQLLLGYFDESLAKPCGNCDNCLHPPETWDATEAARQALSCVYRSGQRFGVGYVIDILQGKSDARIQKNRHEQLSTFGIGEHLSIAEWRSLFRQLIAQGYLYVDHERFGGVRLTEKSRPLLKGEESLHARRLIKPEKTKKAARAKVSTIHQPLMDALKALRRSLADEQGLPPFVIFHDSTLIQMTEKRPTVLREMQFISGVGEKKLAQYGEAFIQVIKEHPLPQQVNTRFSDTVNESLLLFSKELSIETIASQRNLSEETVYGHLAEAIAAGMLDPLDVLPIEQDDYHLISQTISSFVDEPQGRLKKIREVLGDEFSYGVIQCVIAAEEGEG